MRTYPVVEIFGPTVQGEGALAGSPTLFVRFGGCDYHCSWCDSLIAVLPEEVRKNSVKMTAREITERLLQLCDNASSDLWVTLSGGNPALMPFDRDATPLPFMLKAYGFNVSVETQGSVWRPWLRSVDHLTISPKPPSSGMATVEHAARTETFMLRAWMMPYERRSIKIVVFDDTDYEWARAFIKQRIDNGEHWQTFLSVGTDQVNLDDTPSIHAGISERYRWLCEQVAYDPLFRTTKVLPQLHVIAWGAKRGV